jgi:Amt family ammonium transporter
MQRIHLVSAHLGTVLLLLGAPTAHGADSATQAASDTVWLAVAAALVFFMQAGFALLESGMSRAKNAINVMMKNYLDVCVGSLAFWALGYGIMFGSNPSGWLGIDHFFLGTAEAHEYTFLLFQTMFAATAVTIASGAMAERTRFHAYLLSAVATTALIYPVFGSWVWGSYYTGSGWLAELGFIDFAGSTVVHSVGGWIALAGIIILGPRLGKYDPDGRSRNLLGHNLSLVALGGLILWLGWFGFNGGSTAAADVSIGLINLNTHLAAASGALGAWLMLFLLRRPILLTTSVNGSIGGLVAITAGCATMTPPFAALTGLIAGIVVVTGTLALDRWRLDDVVGAVPVHGLCGAWGTLAAGLFLTGNLFDPSQIGVQMLGILAGLVWTLPVALGLFWLIDQVVGLRVPSQSEQRGLDYAEHYEIGYPEFQQGLLHSGKE